ncbi:hypothetical protein [Pontibacillus yanchengensis]|uniref:Uncharacterized protein n=1 Tax=Pontibacillus yanchengensis Y32 TaxID=1385514 RepID=A0A0A2TG87_9BACI|nr:hypothetical protein [Pontibacillus yanchengensis]KGP74574.1 hypothetical protein N782_00380 [Pontibacillus yanchengensis Y32]
MDSAYLHNSVFNIELKRKELEGKKMSRDEIKQWFENNYRVFSKKSAFTCLCCHKPVNMNLTKEEGRPFYFRHNDESECSYSENTKTYEKHVSKHEEKTKKDIGLTIFREILEGELRPFDAEIERGTHYKKKLSFIPDFIVKFPNSEEKWAIDYFTAIDQGKNSGSYARHLSKRMETYKEEGFESFSFVDYSWLSFLEVTNKGTLLTAETYVTSKTSEDEVWDTFLENHVKDDLLDFFMKYTEATMEEFDTRNIAYVDVYNGLCTAFRFIPISRQNRNITYYKLSSSQVPLAQALSVNADQNHFVLTQENEDDKRNKFLNELMEKKQQIEAEEQERKEELEKNRAEKDKIKQEELEQKRKMWAEEEDKRKERLRTQEQVDEQTEKEMQERMRRASLRPIEVHPDQWNYRSQRQRRYRNYTYQQSPPKTLSMETEESADQTKRERVKQVLLSQPIKGESYIDEDKGAWRKVILKWIKENQSGGKIFVSLQQVIDYMKSLGISFNQSDKVIKYPIQEFFEFYEKTVNGEFKKNVEIIIQE